MKELIKTLQEIDTITCRAMKEWDGIDIAKIPKEFHGYREILAKVDLVLSRHSAEVEPLAVLADRKGYWLLSSTYCGDDWSFYMRSDDDVYEGPRCPNYAEAEAKAREWLEKQEDK